MSQTKTKTNVREQRNNEDRSDDDEVLDEIEESSDAFSDSSSDSSVTSSSDYRDMEKRYENKNNELFEINSDFLMRGGGGS